MKQFLQNIRPQFTGQPEDILYVPTGAEAGLPIDEITCALARADAVISMVMSSLSNDGARMEDSILTDALWSAQSQLALIKKLAYHAHATTKAISNSSIKLATGA